MAELPHPDEILVETAVNDLVSAHVPGYKSLAENRDFYALNEDRVGARLEALPCPSPWRRGYGPGDPERFRT